METISLLQRNLPRWQRRERHGLAVDASPALVLRAVEELTWREVPLFRALMRLRFPSGGPLPDDGVVLEVFGRFGRFRRERGTTELLIYGAIPLSSAAVSWLSSDEANPWTPPASTELDS